MIWTDKEFFFDAPYQKESELEQAVQEVKHTLFGEARIYLEDKRRIGAKGKTKNIPDGYLLDLSNEKDPKIFAVENDLASHQHLKHIAVQILEFSLSFESSKTKVKNIIKDALAKKPDEWKKCEIFALAHGYQNVDFLLESIIHKKDSFNALLIIDEVGEELETVLINRFRFPVEIITLQRFRSSKGETIYQFQPFLYEVTQDNKKVELSELNTIVVPARKEGFKDVFIGKNAWHAIRLNSSMIPKIKYIAAYQVAPISAITHIAEVKSIEPYEDTNKYILHFVDKAAKIEPIKLGKDKGKAPQSSRYSSYEAIRKAKSMDEVF